MPRRPAMTPEQLEAYLGKLQAAQVREFEGLGFRVAFRESGELAALEADMTPEEIEQMRQVIARRKAREELELENWSSD